MLRVSHVDVARHIRSGPERAASAFENPVAQVDEKYRVDYQR
jgi:hypothetical protein